MTAKSLYRAFLNISAAVFGTTFTKKLDARLRFRRSLNLKEPTTLADKLCFLELYRPDPRKSACTDKYAVRDYVTGKGLSEILIPLVAPPVSRLEDIDWDSLPQKFTMKAAHGCGMNLLCQDKSRLDRRELMRKAELWLRQDYARACIEPHYKAIPHRLVFADFLECEDSMVDYKFHCFHGEPDFILVCSDRDKGVQKRLYTLDWQPIDAMVGPEKGSRDYPRPAALEEMIAISRRLSADFDFVRVDLYNVRGKVYFGELTFTPASGILPNFSEEFLKEKGKLLKL